MTRSLSCAWILLSVSGAIAQPAVAQVLGPDRADESPPAVSQQPADPLERTTPRDAITSFVRAVERDDLVSAARYLQTAEPRENTDALARDLKSLIDRYFGQPLTTIDDSPDGALDDGLEMDRERVGPLTIGERTLDIELIRVTHPQSGPIWLISSETLARVPDLRDFVEQSWIERTLPRALVKRDLFGVSLAHWAVFAASLLVPLLLLALITGICAGVARRVVRNPVRRRELDTWYAAVRWPAIAAMTLVIQGTFIPALGFPVTFRIVYARIAVLLFVVAAAWLMRRLLTLGFARARSMTWGKDAASTRSLMVLGERLLKALVLVVAIIVTLLILGVESKTALAAFGIVGVALALGAQRTVENLLGGVFMLSDRAIAVGDLCSISNRLGWIEDITLRSVRLRTLDNSLVSVPAGVLAQEGIENFATREKILAQNILRLQHGTHPDQLRRILSGVRKLLDANPKIERDTSRIRLVNFAAEAIELELFAYVLTADVPEFLAIREELLLEIAATIDAEGSGFAQPTQFIYLDETPITQAVAPKAGARSDTRSSQSIAGASIDSETLAASR